MSKRGFTLLEILITTMLLSIGVVTVIRAIADGTSADSSTQGRAVALMLAQEQMEVVRNTPFSSIASVGRRAFDDASFHSFDDYTYAIVVTAPVAGESDALKQVDVNVYWMFKDSEQTIGLHTYKANLTPD